MCTCKRNPSAFAPLRPARTPISKSAAERSVVIALNSFPGSGTSTAVDAVSLFPPELAVVFPKFRTHPRPGTEHDREAIVVSPKEFSSFKACQHFRWYPFGDDEFGFFLPDLVATVNSSRLVLLIIRNPGVIHRLNSEIPHARVLPVFLSDDPIRIIARLACPDGTLDAVQRQRLARTAEVLAHFDCRDYRVFLRNTAASADEFRQFFTAFLHLVLNGLDGLPAPLFLPDGLRKPPVSEQFPFNFAGRASGR